QVPGKGRAVMKRARQVEAELLAQVAAGQHRGSKTKTVGKLIERGLEWRRAAGRRARVAAGQHRGSKTKTVAKLIERWLEWRLSVRPISPTTVAAYRGYIDRSILPRLGRLQVR